MNRGFRSAPICAVLGLILLALAAPARAWAMSPYAEFGFGLAKFNKSSTFFGSGAPDSTAFGPGFNLGLYLNFASKKSANFSVHFGIQHRTTMGSSGNSALGMQSLYPLLRFDISRVYVGMGATTLLWHRKGSEAGFDNFNSATGSTGYLGEIGYEHPIIPSFSFGVQLDAEFINGSGGMSPAPAMSGTFQMRFYIGNYNTINRTRRSYSPDGDYSGWRYPYGQEKN